MAIKSSGIISMGGTHDGTDGSILNEKQGNTTARTSISLKGLSVDGIADSSGGDITGTPDASTPYKMSEFHGYSHGSWGTNTNPTTNLTSIFNQYQENRDADDTCVVTSCNMVLNTSTKVITYSFSGTEDSGGRSGNIFTTNGGSIAFTGTINSLEARFVHVGQAITLDNSGSDNGKIIEMFSNNGHLSAADVNNNNVTGSIISTNNDISGGPAGTFRALRTTSGNMSVAIAAMSDNVSQLNDYSRAKITYSGSDSLTIQLRMNGSTVVNLYQRTGSFEMEAESSDEGSS
jgi:hypothetical protein